MWGGVAAAWCVKDRYGSWRCGAADHGGRAGVRLTQAARRCTGGVAVCDMTGLCVKVGDMSPKPDPPAALTAFAEELRAHRAQAGVGPGGVGGPVDLQFVVSAGDQTG